VICAPLHLVKGVSSLVIGYYLTYVTLPVTVMLSLFQENVVVVGTAIVIGKVPLLVSDVLDLLIRVVTLDVPHHEITTGMKKAWKSFLRLDLP
jgi:hypothetical protein